MAQHGDLIILRKPTCPVIRDDHNRRMFFDHLTNAKRTVRERTHVEAMQIPVEVDALSGKNHANGIVHPMVWSRHPFSGFHQESLPMIGPMKMTDHAPLK
ncbi:MAG: hypothetical protein BWY82_02832 [Verrucomicrobia bacterium ADurb.Bin474]|nr:MAG: hypothetical protein BWY82_02832 [Verrucomicrobia bacterium ADurb.Bin474]